jgi:hypothetical protein
MTYEEYFPQCCYKANEVPEISTIRNKETLLNVENGNPNKARFYLTYSP